MILGKVIGDLVSTAKIEDYESLKILFVQPIDSDGNPAGKVMIGVDGCQAGPGDTVLVMDEGGSARMLLDTPEIMTIRTVVAGVVDMVSKEVE